MYFDHIHLPRPSPCHLPTKFISCVALDFYNPPSPISAVYTAPGVEHGQAMGGHTPIQNWPLLPPAATNCNVLLT